MDIAVIQGTLSGLKTAADIAKGILELRSMAEVQGKVVELQSAILSAQSSALAAMAEQSTLAEESRRLRDELASVKAWEQQRQRYQLVSPFDGVLVYALRESASNGEPAHWICTKCYEDGKRSILSVAQKPAMRVAYYCPTCKSEVPSPWSNITAPGYAPG